ncbi:unnamed protein product [Rotaria sp. Silwood2]|nr:unnamed protein product [Rotaria sp. Silwood2]CAF3051730.1 unnamed protein product [Rotaria sp. Silwood2]CAF3239652.1 unnamed protein product [Rotaria sp. Silwood2]CAF4224922.1 unnamed protein product [Rotaria sp. Silwood2]CAF4225507.1 unnamed protein product [Rotaria sp. Silwood2]
MPQKSKRKCRATTAAGRRWTTETFARSDDDSDEQISMNLSNLSENDQQKFSLKDKINISDIGDLFEIVKSQTSLRSLSVLIYLSLMYFGVSWRKADLFLKQIGSLSAETCNKWSEVFIEGDLDDFLEDNRGSKRGQSFFDTFPELENMAKLYTLEGCTRKSASFTSLELAQYLNEQYYELTGEVRKAVFCGLTWKVWRR